MSKFQSNFVQLCATLQNGKSKSESAGNAKSESRKYEIWKLKSSERLRHGKCRKQTLCNSAKWKVQIWMGNLKAGNMTSESCMCMPQNETWTMSKFKSNLVQISEMESPKLKAGNGKSESRKYTESWKCFRKSQTWKMSKFQNQTLQNGKSKSESS